MPNGEMINEEKSSRKWFSRSARLGFAFVAALAVLLVLPACSVKTNEKSADGEKRVDIQSPVGNLHVSEQVDIRDAGLSVYPGAKPAPKDDSDDKKSANVNLAVPGFALKVVAAEFSSTDSPEKISAYYDKELQKYGKPIQCKGSWKSGHVDASPDKDDFSKPVSCDGDAKGNSVELKVGTEGSQHLVSVRPDGAGTRFALVYVRMRTGKEDMI